MTNLASPVPKRDLSPETCPLSLEVQDSFLTNLAGVSTWNPAPRGIGLRCLLPPFPTLRTFHVEAPEE